MTRFRQDNTEGYSQADLVKLNAAFEELKRNCTTLLKTMDEQARKSYEDHLAERIQTAFDNRY